jgi:hypothetical protein
MGRRDISFYDLYKLNEPLRDLQDLKKESFWVENIYDPEIYEDMEINDFNVLFRNEDFIL